MKTVVGVKTFAEAETMLRLGADELYGGYAEVPNHRDADQSFQLTPEEAAPLLKNRLGLETEVFFHGDFCRVNVDPACR